MKKLFLKTMLLLCALVVGSSSLWATEATYSTGTLTGSVSKDGGNITWSSVQWTYSSATYLAIDSSSRLQIGSKKNPQTTAWTIQTPISSFGTGKAVKSVSFTGYTTATTATYDISVNGASVKSGSLATSSDTYTANNLNAASGDIVITMTGSSSSKAMYLSGISVTYDDAATNPEATISTTSLNFGEVVYGQSKDMTFTVTPANLTGDLTISSNNPKYTVTPTSIAQATTAATTITVTSAPTAGNDNMDGTITISGGGITDKTVTLTTTVVKPSAELAYAVPSYKVVKDYENFPTPTLTNPHNLDITYSSSDDDIAAVVYDNTGEILVGSKIGTATITATFAGNEDYAAGTATYTITTFDTKGTEANPYNVTEALVKINEIGNTNSEKVYVRGIVCTAPTSVSSGKATYDISVDGTATNTIKVYKGLGLGGANFSAASDLAEGDEVLIAGTLIKYNNTTPEINQGSSIINLKHGSAAEVKSVSVTADKYNTFVATENLIVPTGVTAYIATGESETTLTLKSVAKIKAGTPVILYADVTAKTRYQFEVTDEDVTYLSPNLLNISDGTTINGVFVLAKINDQVGFYKWAGGALSPGRVYVDAPSSAAREFLGIEVENDVTGINDVKGEKKVVDGIFDLQGRKVITPSKGLYIMNGKKVVIK